MTEQAESWVEVKAALFDMDGVVTDTARVHAAAWKRLFDEFLEARANRLGEEFRPFDPRDDYRRFVDGKPRADGIRRFLAARGIELPAGTKDDGPDEDTVAGLGNRKNRYFHVYREALAAEQRGEDTIFLHSRTNQSLLGIAQAARTRMYRDGIEMAAVRRTISEEQGIAQEIAFALAEAEAVGVEKIIALYTSRDWAIFEPGLEALRALGRTGRFDAIRARHESCRFRLLKPEERVRDENRRAGEHSEAPALEPQAS